MKYTTDEWWASLTVEQKERIGYKCTHQSQPYPKCTEVWSHLTEETKQKIHDHCVDCHGHFMTEWTEGQTYSY